MNATAQAGTGIDKILETGRSGLGYFTTFLPRYRTWTGSDPSGESVNSLTTKYEQQSGMDVEPLRTFATALGKELFGSVADQVKTQQARHSELPARWSGSPAADQAASFVQALSKQVGGEHDSLSGIQKAVSTAADTLEQIVHTKADAIRTDLTAQNIAGKSAEQIDQIIAYAHGGLGEVGDADAKVQLVRKVLSDIPSGSDATSYCAQWLDKVFKPAMEGKVAAFTTLTDATDTAVKNVYDQLSQALESVNSTPYISPGGQRSATTALADTNSASTPSGTFVAAQTLFQSNTATAPASVSASASDQAPAQSNSQQSNQASTAPAATDAGTGTSAAATAASTGTASTASSPQNTASYIAADTTAGTGASNASAKASNSGAGQSAAASGGSPASPTPAANTPTSDSGTWKPADIAGVLTAGGTVVQDLGSAFKDVVGQDGITGLVKEGVDAAQKIDAMVEHHIHPTAASASSDTSGADHSTDAASKSAGDNTNQTSGTQSQSDSGANASQAGSQSSQTAGQSVPVSGSQNDTTTTSSGYQPFNLGSSTTTTSTTPSSFFGNASLPQSRSENESEHRTTIRYVPPAAESEPEETNHSDETDAKSELA
ncbi:hypothetical protein [Nocardia vaccinii]|uniref:hypothetical protein n=1 Tax=Nocardia vaccinii TaxID=1822 RepID=UPI00083175D3|nr:hypothetical protein [Nocardia vaccinii]